MLSVGWAFSPMPPSEPGPLGRLSRVGATPESSRAHAPLLTPSARSADVHASARRVLLSILLFESMAISPGWLVPEPQRATGVPRFGRGESGGSPGIAGERPAWDPVPGRVPGPRGERARGPERG